jgi:putative flippase GtrA
VTATTISGGLNGRIVRFLIVGGSNTAITGILVIVLSLFIPGWLAFTTSYALGLIYSVALTGRFVFRSYVSWRRALLYTLSYLIIYLCGLAIIQLLHFWGAPPIANGATVLVTAPLGFLAGMFIFTKDKRRNSDQ